MSNTPVQARELGPAQLRLLLTLSRELLQTDEASSALGLAGRALADMLRPDSALLLAGDRLSLVGFDRSGAARPAGTDHPLYRTAISLLSGTGSAANEERYANRESAAARTLGMAVPAPAPIATIVVAWEHELSATELESYKPALSYLVELTVAAIGKIDARCSLERIVSDQREQIASTSEVHAAELARRDEVAIELRMVSLTDVLTGLYNRRGFYVQAEQVFKVAQRKHSRSAVIFADIDGLKRVNDELGHEVGDSLIRDAALVFRQSFRQADVVSRLGGDEFVAYTLDDEKPGVVLERIRANLRAFNMMQERPYTVSISAGVVQCDPDAAQSLSHYVLLADDHMYAQKRSRLH